MGKLNIFTITFSNFQGVYYAGQNVQGHLTIELIEEMSMRGIRLKFEGKAYVHWTESHTTGTGDKRHTEIRHYSASEQYFNQDVLVFGKWPNQGSDTTKLPAGRHVFPFSFVLPPNLPSSFEAYEGHVRYLMKGVIDKPWKFDHTTKRAFTVISILDLNLNPNAQTPVQGHDEKMICCLCCATGPIAADFRLERRGYVPGEPIHLFADIRNNSNRKIDKTYIDLRMITTFHATCKSRTTCKEVSRITQGSIPERGSFSWEGQQIVIPPLPPSYLTGCKIIDIRYILQLNVDPAGPAIDLEVPLEIILGTIPLRQVLELCPPLGPSPFQQPPQAGYGETLGTVHPLPEGASAPYLPLDPSAPPMMPFMPATSIPTLPPPSYNECVFGKVNVKEEDDDENTRGNLEFVPLYSYYDWGHPPTAGDSKH